MASPAGAVAAGLAQTGEAFAMRVAARPLGTTALPVRVPNVADGVRPGTKRTRDVALWETPVMQGEKRVCVSDRG